MKAASLLRLRRKAVVNAARTSQADLAALLGVAVAHRRLGPSSVGHDLGTAWTHVVPE
jgi:hypothetical protein